LEQPPASAQVLQRDEGRKGQLSVSDERPDEKHRARWKLVTNHRKNINLIIETAV
jgi:hypothetical protein